MKTKLPLIAITAFIAATIFTFHACKKLDFNRVTKCNVENVTVINATTVKVEVDVFDLSPADHPDYGICYSITNETPTIADSKVSMGAISEYKKYTKSIENLNPKSKYYFRGYVMNGSEPKYSFDVRDGTLPSLATLPIITTTIVSSITQTAASSGGNISSDGGAALTAHGVCWSTSQNPVVTGNHTSDGTGTGNFISSITGLTINTTYFIRAYATNSAGTAYGNELSFTTLSIACPTTVTDFDGNTYDVVSTGSQCWMKQNLKSTHYSNGTAMVDGTSAGNITGNDSTKYYFDYDNISTNTTTYGKLYTWAAVMKGAASSTSNPSGIQGACPTGWHIPSDAEWTQLTDKLGGASVAGGKMKETGTSHWTSPNTGADNNSSFTGLPAGFRSNDGSYTLKGNLGDFWSATQFDATSAWTRSLYYNYAGMNRSNNNKTFGFSIRCLKD